MKHVVKHVVALTFSCLLLAGCQSAHAMSQRPAQAPQAASQAPIAQASVKEAAALLAADSKLVLLDVRTPEEFASGHAPGALLRPLGELGQWAGSLDPKAGYVVICRSGNRSLRASQGLVERGFQHVTNVRGGMLEWEAEGLPVTK